MTYKRIGPTLAALAVGLIASSCATSLSPMQKRQMTTRTIDGTYEDTYRATMTVLQDHGYTIRNTDLESGLVSAYAFRNSDGTRGFELSCVIQERNERRTELRMTIRKERSSERRSWLVELLSSDSADVYDRDIYDGFFGEIAVEVRRIEASR